MDYTREPIVETVIIPKEGCKLAVRNSKGVGQEEYFVDALEVVSFGNSFFFRSVERPKSFLLPVTDYEVIEVRESRVMLKHSGVGRNIKIGGGKDTSQKKQESKSSRKSDSEDSPPVPVEPRVDKKRERRRYRRRRGGEDRDEQVEELAETEKSAPQSKDSKGKGKEPKEAKEPKDSKEAKESKSSRRRGNAEEAQPKGEADSQEKPTLQIQPPSGLISDTIQEYKQSGMYQEAFFSEEEQEASEDTPALEEESVVVGTKESESSQEVGGDADRFPGGKEDLGAEPVEGPGEDAGAVMLATAPPPLVQAPPETLVTAPPKVDAEEDVQEQEEALPDEGAVFVADPELGTEPAAEDSAESEEENAEDEEATKIGTPPPKRMSFLDIVEELSNGPQ